MVPILILLFLCITQNYYAVAYAHKSRSHSSFTRLHLPSLGSESLAFDPQNGGPYTGLNDGRIVKYQGPKLGFVDFATTTSNRSKELCDGTDGNNRTRAFTCGKPTGLEFNQKTGELYILDAIYGLLVIGKEGGVAKQLAPATLFDFADGIDIDQTTGVVYITDLGTMLLKSTDMAEILRNGTDGTGRLLKYDPRTKAFSVLLTGLDMPAGLAISADGSFLLIGEYLTSKITRYWLKGPHANTSHTFLTLPGNVDNIKRTASGDFWVTVNIQKLEPQLTPFPMGQRVSPYGEILETVNFYKEYNSTYITEVNQRHGQFYVASINADFVGNYIGRLRC